MYVLLVYNVELWIASKGSKEYGESFLGAMWSVNPASSNPQKALKMYVGNTLPNIYRWGCTAPSL
ncbi:hypothetical protein Csa_003379 [Cucumis sativus]|uniref:Uncharacterized protein n=1 Tax=Cucumis sativus TaxID=3659 RepID=A0A0A0KJC1_CUCSA|nr:hypothetical protein Csa_003379 [Cucumis sativus]